MMPDFELDTDRIATGGAAIGYAPDGRVCFVDGALPGERVAVEVVTEKRRHFEVKTLEVLSRAPGRATPACDQVERGCGGCDWQHASSELQTTLRQAIVVDCLRRIAGIESVTVETGPELPAAGYRTTVRVAIEGERAGFRRHRKHEVVVATEGCMVAHPLIDQIITHGRFHGCPHATIRVGANTGERMVLLPAGGEVTFGPGVDRPDEIQIVEEGASHPGEAPVYHELIHGVRFQVSAPSFFQCRPDGAAALVDVVDSMVQHRSGILLDAYSGVGLFAATVGRDRDVVAVESNRFAVADAGVNLAPRASDNQASEGTRRVEIVRCDMKRWRPHAVDTVVADPAREGLGAPVVERLAETKAKEIILVSCDPASLARDARLFQERGYQLERVVTVDLFGQTSHVESVSRFVPR